MEISTSKYGTHGLPVFGSKGIDYNGRQECIGQIETAFTQFLATVKNNMLAGNEAALIEFANGLESLWPKALKTVAGKQVVNA